MERHLPSRVDIVPIINAPNKTQINDLIMNN